jgi:hypothetical protein
MPCATERLDVTRALACIGGTVQIVGAALLGALPALGCAPSAPGLSEAVITRHRVERTAVGVGALRWSDRLACDAQYWADYLERLGGSKLLHAPANVRQNAGENLWLGTQSFFSYHDMLASWAAERLQYHGDMVSEANVHQFGHYTQMIWTATREVGCGLAHGGGNDILVCRYAPAGNIVGERP